MTTAEGSYTRLADPGPRPYYFEGGLRKVAPYYWSYKTNCKERWRGRTLYEVYSSEFRDRPAEYYQRAVDDGTVTVNGKTVGGAYVLKNGDLISHTLHRHEPPVTAESVRVLHEDEGMMVIIKPSGVPVHPAGRYGFNSVVEIIKDERGRDFLPRPCHRLDRLTSGIMFMAKTAESAVALSKKLAERSVRKEYIARVVGEFPEETVVCDQPILQISAKHGLNRVRANGKSARTVFKRLAYYPRRKPAGEEEACAHEGTPEELLEEEKKRPWIRKTGYSIVRCLPETGRTHQIRVHLQHLGHPIENDTIYANQKVWGFNLGSGDTEATENTDEDIISRLERMGKVDVADAVAYHDEMVNKYEKERAERLSGEKCPECGTLLYSDPGLHELSLWLHSLRYEDAHGAWSYVTPLPSWALPPEGAVGPTEVGGMEALLVDAVKAEQVPSEGAGQRDETRDET
jgi:tRNA pseudouridine32 synthase